MESLLDRMKPECREILETETKIKHPETYKEIIKACSKVSTYQLTLSEVVMITTMITGFTKGIEKIFYIFND